MFSDRAKINVSAGRGGNGCASFRREKHVPRGGPDGGDGGPGGDVYVVADPQLRDLGPFMRKVHFKAQAGRHGQGSRKDGAAGPSLEIPVPLGTVVYRDDVLIADLTRTGQRALVAAGGQGGRGNTHFVTSSRQTPRFSERGDEGESVWLDLSLKLMADVGLAGMPNAGKSSLLKRLSNAQPKVANYPFTTVEPLLGVVEVPGGELTFTLADVPGLLEGAAEGVGLGHEFLAHLERCHLLLHVVDVTGYYGADPVENFRTILTELGAHAPALGSTPEIVVLNKVDAIDASTRAERRVAFYREVEELRAAGHPAFCWQRGEGPPSTDRMIWEVSAATGEGLAELVVWVGSLVSARRAEEMASLDAAPTDEGSRVRAGLIAPWPSVEEGRSHMVYRPTGIDQEEFDVEREDDHFVVQGVAVERLVRRYDLENDQAVRYLGERLDRAGVYGALRQAGAEPGDEVHIAGFVFEFD